MKTILACLSCADDAKKILRVALPIARKHGSHLIGFHVQERMVFYPGVAVHVPTEVYVSFQEKQDEDASAIKAVFDELTQGVDVACEWRVAKAVSPDTSELLIQAAHTADLVVMAQGDGNDDRSSVYYLQEHVIRRSGRPVLYVPAKQESQDLGNRVVIGWSASREAARAAHDALPLLSSGAEVIVATVTKGAEEDYGGATELARALDRHGHSAEVVHRTAHNRDVAKELDNLAFERGADMIVTGAFGHSRLYDFVIGAVTIDLMVQARLPVLFSK